MGAGNGLNVLHLVTAQEIFFEQQIETLEDKGVNCTVCTVPGAEQIDGAMANKRGIKEYLRYFPKVRKELRNGQFDLIHANYGLTVPYAVMQKQLPVVVTLWGSDVVGFDGLVTKAFTWRADAVTVRSKEMKELLGIDEAYILPSGVNMDLFRPIDQNVAREKVGWDIDGTYVLFPYSPDYERKNYPLAKTVVDQTQLHFDQSIALKTLSGVSHEKMPYYLNAADCLLLTSKYEGSPNTVKEAMACNVPVVSTNVGDVSQRLNGVEIGGVATDKNELIELLIHTLASHSRSNARNLVQDISWEMIGQKLISIYYNVI